MFTNYIVNNVVNIKPVINTENNKPEIEIIPYQTPDFNVKAVLRVHVDLNDGATQEYLKEGENIIELDFTYNDRLEQWTITSVSSEAVENSDLQNNNTENEFSTEESEKE